MRRKIQNLLVLSALTITLTALVTTRTKNAGEVPDAGSPVTPAKPQPQRKDRYTGISATDAREMAQHYSDRNKDIAHYLDSSNASSASPWSKEELLKMLNEDAPAVWYSMDELESYINALKQQAAAQHFGTLRLGIRIYFGRYNANVCGIPGSYINRKTVFLVPTYDSLVMGKNGYEKMPVDFNPWLHNFSKKVMPGFGNNNLNVQTGASPEGVWVTKLEKPGPAAPAGSGSGQYKLLYTAKLPPDSVIKFIMNHSQIPPFGKPGGSAFNQH